IAQFPLPIISINRKETYSGRTFSMIHELTHVMLRESCLCDLEQTQNSDSRSQRIEVFCNHVAGAALVSQEHILSDPIVLEHSGPEWNEFQILSLSKKFCVSREVILRRLLTVGKTTKNFYQKKRNDYQKELESIPKKKGGFVPPSTNVVSTTGKPYTRIVIDAFNSNRITTSDASDYLGVKLKHLGKISRAVGIE
nr:ImmA/IrrE family metallo-endopeptidase [Bacteroidales bacterium]